MTRFVLVVSLLLSGSALAQIQNTLTVRVELQPEIVVVAADCGSELTVTWSVVLSTGNTPNGDLKFWATTGDCGDNPVATDVPFSAETITSDRLTTLPSGTFKIRVDALPSFTPADGGPACGTSGIEATNRICAAFTFTNGTSTATTRATPSPSIIYDTKAPAVPSIDGVTGLDGALTVSFSADDDTIFVHLELRRAGEADFVQVKSVGGDLNSARLEGLENGVTYEVRAIAEDDVENRSEPSEPGTGTPVKSSGFYSAYVAAGGTDKGGCTAAGGGALAVLGLVTLTGLVSRRRRS
ncbi:MAG: MXAN_2561 family MXYO-CTERM-anchored protein [Myxococcaceae bacterium]